MDAEPGRAVYRDDWTQSQQLDELTCWSGGRVAAWRQHDSARPPHTCHSRSQLRFGQQLLNACRQDEVVDGDARHGECGNVDLHMLVMQDVQIGMVLSQQRGHAPHHDHRRVWSPEMSSASGTATAVIHRATHTDAASAWSAMR